MYHTVYHVDPVQQFLLWSMSYSSRPAPVSPLNAIQVLGSLCCVYASILAVCICLLQALGNIFNFCLAIFFYSPTGKTETGGENKGGVK